MCYGINNEIFKTVSLTYLINFEVKSYEFNLINLNNFFIKIKILKKTKNILT
jgi:hypothetical protein